MGNIKMANKEGLIKNPLLLNGIGRAGKFFLGKLICGLQNIEYFQYISLLEHLPYMERLGCIKKDAAVSLLRINADEHAYNMWIGRNLNSRKEDASSIYNSPDKELFLERSVSPVPENITEIIRTSGRYSLFILHDSLPNIRIFFDAFPSMKWINLTRHPVDLIHSWYRRGWGHRFGEDPLSFIPVIKGNQRYVPWYAYDWKDEYEKMSEMDRIVRSIKTLFELGEKVYNSLSEEEKKQILFVSYENAVEKTEAEIGKVAAFLDTKPCPGIEDVFKRENCPSKLSLEKRQKKADEIRLLADKKLFDEIMKMSSRYEEGMLF